MQPPVQIFVERLRYLEVPLESCLEVCWAAWPESKSPRVPGCSGAHLMTCFTHTEGAGRGDSKPL